MLRTREETELLKKIAGITLSPKNDPMRRVRGWSQMARIVSAQRAKLADGDAPVFVIGGHYGTTSLLNFYMPEARKQVAKAPFVYYRALPKPNTQFYFWPGYIGVHKGQNAIYVQEKNKPGPAPPDIMRSFASVTEVGEFPIQYHGRIFHRVQVFACRDLQR